MAETARYRAFISYSHRDAAFAARLHRRLEGYRLPAHLAPGGDRRLSPIFKDREELPAASDLSTQVRAALAVSDVLIIVCSPDAAASPWVGREIETFRALHPDRPVLAALVRGEPAEAFHPALSASGAEPLAADFRKAGDGERLAFLKLVAGLAGVGLDRLIQRDAQRRLRAVIAVTAASVTAMVAMGAMLLFALDARAEAERQRGEAEGLVDFMLTDLRDRLEGVAQLRVLGAVNERALQYYTKQNLKTLSAPSLIGRSKVLNAMGIDEIRRGNFVEAERIFLEAKRSTQALYNRDPSNAAFIFSLAQSEFGLGSSKLHRGQFSKALEHFKNYRTLAIKLTILDPTNPLFLRELGYAEGNICTTILMSGGSAAKAADHCDTALIAMASVFKLLPKDSQSEVDLANRYAWSADVCRELADFDCEAAHRKSQEVILGRLIAADPHDLSLKKDWVGLQRALASLAWRSGDVSGSLGRLDNAARTVSSMIEHDPDNAEWRRLASRVSEHRRVIRTLGREAK